MSYQCQWKGYQMYICSFRQWPWSRIWDSSKQRSTTRYRLYLFMFGGDDDDDDCWLSVITAPPALMSLLLRQMMGHLCLTVATGISGPFLPRLIITPSGREDSQSRESSLDHFCATGTLLSGCQLDKWLLLSSCGQLLRMSAKQTRSPPAVWRHFRLEERSVTSNNRLFSRSAVCRWHGVQWRRG